MNKKSLKRPRRQPIIINNDFFMNRHYQELTRAGMNGKEQRVTKNLPLSVLHQNVQSISNKQTKLDLMLKSSLRNINVFCFTEHWVKEDYLYLLRIDRYKLVSILADRRSMTIVDLVYM